MFAVRVSFTSNGWMKWEMDREIGNLFVLLRCCEDRAGQKSKALDLPIRPSLMVMTYQSCTDRTSPRKVLNVLK